MKKLFILLLTVMCISTAFTDDFSEKGLISGWKFVPVQVGVGFFSPKQLFDTDSTALFSLGLLGVKQRSSIISLGAVSELKNNCGMPLAFISIADKNCGFTSITTLFLPPAQFLRQLMIIGKKRPSQEAVQCT